jgi:flagellar M-ring protein FliF
MLNSLQTTWQKLTLTQRIALGAVLAAVFGGVLMLATVASRPTYTMLYSHLAPEDAGTVTARLRDQKIDYRLTDNGQTIEVPQDKVDDLRLTLATEGLPRDGESGFEIFDKANFGATDFSNRMNYKRALQGELTRTIKKLDSVTDARVLLAMPEKPLFSDKEDPVTASVWLHLRPGYRPSERQIGGIVHLVSSAVERLRPENVSIHDAEGNLLSNRPDSTQLSGGQIDMQQRLEKSLSDDLQALANRVLGPGKSAIRVSAELDWDQTELTSEVYKPSGVGGANLPVETSSTSENYARGSSAGTPSVLGAAPALPNAAPQGKELKALQSQSRFVVNKTTEKRMSAPGKVKRLSVAVFLDAKIDAVQQQQLRNALAAGAGLDLAPVASGGRGDKIEVMPIPFDKSDQQAGAQELASTDKKQMQMALVRNGAAVLVALLVAAFTLLMLRKPRAKPLPVLSANETPSLDTLIGDDLPPALEAMETGLSVTGRIAGGSGTVDPDLTPLDRLQELTTQNPEEIARLLQIWLKQVPARPVPPL